MLTKTPRSPSSSGSFSLIAAAARLQHVEGADQVDLDHLREHLEVVGAALVGDPLGPADAGAADRDPQAAVGVAARSTAAATASASVTSASTKVAPLAQLGGERLALLGVEVGDRHRRRRPRPAPAPSPRRARRPRRRPAPLLPRSASRRSLSAVDRTARRQVERCGFHRPVIRPRIGFSHRHRGEGKLQGSDRGASRPRRAGGPWP